MALSGGSLNIWSGNDDHTVPMMALGAKGLISVVSNLLPAPMVTMTHAALDGDMETAKQIQLAYTPLMRALFSQVNPIPIKTAMHSVGLDSGVLRLPLCPMDSSSSSHLLHIMREMEILP